MEYQQGTSVICLQDPQAEVEKWDFIAHSHHKILENAFFILITYYVFKTLNFGLTYFSYHALPSNFKYTVLGYHRY